MNRCTFKINSKCSCAMFLCILSYARCIFPHICVAYLTIQEFICLRMLSLLATLFTMFLFFSFWLIVHWQYLNISVFQILKRGNFRCTETSVGVETQLCNLASITQVIDPKLASSAFRYCFWISLLLHPLLHYELLFLFEHLLMKSFAKLTIMYSELGAQRL